jgi:carbon-monoxide dehydrogenase large subunit
MVIADNPYLAEDAVSLVKIDYDVLPAVSDCREALSPIAALVHSDGPDNLIAEFVSSYGDVETALASATHIFKDSFKQHRGCAHPMECRGCLAALDLIDDKLTLWSSTQTPLVAARLEETAIRVVSPDVGGGFGPKLVFYPEGAAVAIAAIILNRPVKWIEDRREHFIATTQERDQYWDAEIALDKDGKILGIRGTLIHDTEHIQLAA